MVHISPIYLVIIDLYSYCPLSGVLLILVVPVEIREVLQVRLLLWNEIRSGQYPVVLYKYSPSSATLPVAVKSLQLDCSGPIRILLDSVSLVPVSRGPACPIFSDWYTLICT